MALCSPTLDPGLRRKQRQRPIFDIQDLVFSELVIFGPGTDCPVSGGSTLVIAVVHYLRICVI